MLCCKRNSESIWKWDRRRSVLEDEHLRVGALYYIPAIENLLKVCFQNSVWKELTLRCTKGLRKTWKLIKVCLSSCMCIIGNFAFSCFNPYLLHLPSRVPSCTLTANFNLLMQFIQILYCFFLDHMKASDLNPLGFICVFLEDFRDAQWLIR